jgi:hypothetical protein
MVYHQVVLPADDTNHGFHHFIWQVCSRGGSNIIIPLDIWVARQKLNQCFLLPPSRVQVAATRTPVQQQAILLGGARSSSRCSWFVRGVFVCGGGGLYHYYFLRDDDTKDGFNIETD